MALILSPAALEAMGFKPLATTERIEARFHSYHLYAIEGIGIDEDVAHSTTGSVDGLPYAVAIGGSLKAIARVTGVLITNGDEEKWAKERKCAPPYVSIKVGPTSQHSASVAHTQEHGATIETYDAFPAAREELRSLESRVLPPVLTSLHCTLGTESLPVISFRRVHHFSLGLTPSGRAISDYRIEGSGASGYAVPMKENALEAALLESASLAERANLKAAGFLRLAMEEDDLLKQFLFYFLAIEITVHATFKELRLPDAWSGLADRFVQCAASAWPQVTDEDIARFRNLKTTRDDIAHGGIASPPFEAVWAAKKLATKLQRSPPVK